MTILSASQFGFSVHPHEEGPYGREQELVGRRRVPTTRLHTTQTDIHQPTLQRYVARGPLDEQDSLPDVVEHEGRTWVDGGHHRLAAAHARGEQTAWANVWRTK